MSLRDRKAALRSRIRRELAGLDERTVRALSADIHPRVLGLPELANPCVVFIYVSFGAEPGTHELIDALLARGHDVFAPRITGPGAMEAHRVRSREDLAPGPFGILAPERDDPLVGSPAVCLCPGLAFSERGDRLGRGKAYYDRFLALHDPAFAAGLAFERQIVDDVPTETTDRRLDAVVSERRVIRPPPGEPT